MIDAALRASLAAFDDATLTTLGNPGLVRRAHRDVEEGKVRLVSTADGQAGVEVDGQLVTLDLRGPRAAVCACKSATICRHRIAAVLYLRHDPQNAGAEDADGADGTAKADDAATPEPASDAGDIIAAISLATLPRWAGKAGWRAALELAATPAQVETSAQAVIVTFEQLDGPVHILRGQGAEGIVSKAAKAQAKAWHTAAVLVARQYFGLSLPETTETPESTGPESTGPEIDPHFLERVAVALGEVVTLGFNLAPLPLEESLFELSVSSRADALPRLSAMLRAIAALIRQRRQRALGFDPDAMLELTATAFALIQALRTGEKARLTALAGKVRRDFATTSPLELVGCGGEWWHTDGGARGVTAWFIEPASGRWLSATLARGAGQDPTFIPRHAWLSQTMWRAEPLATLAHARITLEASRLSEDGHISASAEARAIIQAQSVTPDPAGPGTVRHWSAVRDAYLAQAGLGLNRANISAACLLVPEATSPPFFDEFAQQLVWPVRDANGIWLALTLDHELASTAMIALETHVRHDWQGMILARISRAGERLDIRPITLFGQGDPVDLSFWQQPHRREKPDRKNILRDWLAKLKSSHRRHFSQAPRDHTDAALAAAWRQVLDQMEMGPGLRHRLEDGLAPHAERLDSFGLPVLAATLRGARQAPALLTAAYALMIARQQRCRLPLLQG